MQHLVHWYAVRVDGTILINDYNGKSLGKFGAQQQPTSTHLLMISMLSEDKKLVMLL